MNKVTQFSRTELLIGSEGIKKLQSKHVAVFGIGGVGGYVAEALVRSGVGEIDLIDNDVISVSNINRQILALHSTLGQYKVDVAANRLMDINPNVKIHGYKEFYLPEKKDHFDFSKYDYIIDAIDTVSGKISIIEQAYETNKPVISAMGAGNKLDATKLQITDIYKTDVCPLAKIMRKELRKRGIERLKVVYSVEKAIVPMKSDEESCKRQIPGSISYVPSVMGLLIAGEVIRDLLR